MKTTFLTLLCLLAVGLGLAFSILAYRIVHDIAVVGVFLHAIVIGGFAYA